MPEPLGSVHYQAQFLHGLRCAAQELEEAVRPNLNSGKPDPMAKVTITALSAFEIYIALSVWAKGISAIREMGKLEGGLDPTIVGGENGKL